MMDRSWNEDEKLFHHHEGEREGSSSGRRFFSRGGVKYALLELLLIEPMHGYQMMKHLEEQSAGTYKPSAGSIYPTLQMLRDQGFVSAKKADGKKIFEITEDGRVFLQQEREDHSGADAAPIRGSRGGRYGVHAAESEQAMRGPRGGRYEVHAAESEQPMRGSRGRRYGVHAGAMEPAQGSGSGRCGRAADAEYMRKLRRGRGFYVMSAEHTRFIRTGRSRHDNRTDAAFCDHAADRWNKERHRHSASRHERGGHAEEQGRGRNRRLTPAGKQLLHLLKAAERAAMEDKDKAERLRIILNELRSSLRGLTEGN